MASLGYEIPPPPKINQPLQLGVTENVLSVKIMSTLSNVNNLFRAVWD